jgi:hypothetical protein
MNSAARDREQYPSFESARAKPILLCSVFTVLIVAENQRSISLFGGPGKNERVLVGCSSPNFERNLPWPTNILPVF